MAKRRLQKEPSGEVSDLSPPPKDIENGAAALEKEQPIEQPSAKKRKTATQPKGRKAAVEIPKDEVAEEETAKSSPKVKRTKKVQVEEEDQSSEEAAEKAAPKKRQRKTKKVKEEDEEDVDKGEKAGEQKVKRKRKTKEEKEAEAMPLAARTVGHKLFIGAHVSSAGGVHNAPINSVHIGANAFALFLKSQRKWVNPALQSEHADTFHSHCKHHTYDQTKHVVPHGSYLVNLAHTDKARTTQAYDAFLDDLQRCERLGIKLYNFHPGVANSVNGDRAKAIAHLASNINRAHAATSTVVTLLENMAAGGNVLGSTFEDLRDIIALIDNKDRVGVCIDTCHAFAAGYDLRTPDAFNTTMSTFNEIVGTKYLRAFHVNDSKAPFASHKDLHANIGTGFLGLRSFHNLVNSPLVTGLPLILETPVDVRDADGKLVKDDKGKDKEDKLIWATEIKLLESLVGMDVESEEFLALERDLARKGKPERERLEEVVERKRVKDAKKGGGKGKGKGGTKKGKKGTNEESSGLSDLDGSEGNETDGAK